ncbi:MAG: 16S rRNA (cytidine(1402)-2'-O)-methyltransferase [Legionellaceae bacterium]|nr:16S rRNA (cytidine(1402)-2'-O)-methyltransferase [Legionellaceae bacterium]
MTATSARTFGTLFIVATPIGNKNDISLRALETLKLVDVILAEDTRHSILLLSSFGIKKPLQSLHAFNENDKSASIVEQLQAGKSFALISDAGTPLISDPGYPLVSLARSSGVEVVPIPGACAFIAALSAAGIPCDSISYFGFLPAKSSARCAKLTSVKNLSHTLVFYESTHRILHCLKDIGAVFGDLCQVVLAKELTKTFEKIMPGTVTEVLEWLEDDKSRCKGEFVVIIPPRDSLIKDYDGSEVLKILLKDLPLKQAVVLAAEITQQPKNDLYKLALTFGDKN